MKVSLASSLAFLALLHASLGQAAPPKQRLIGQTPRLAVAQARLMGRVASTEPIALALTLPLRDQAGLTEFLSRLYTPGDPQYGHFLTTQQFTQRFGPTAQDYQAVQDFARAQGLTVTHTHPNRLIVDVSAPASTVEGAFGVHLQRYQSRAGRLFRAPDADPAIPPTLAGRLAGVVGLDTATVRTARLHPALNPADGTGVGGGLSPSDIRTAYNLQGITEKGEGQTIALFELDGYNPADIRAYQNRYGLTATPLQNVLVDGFSGTPGAGADEVTLDIELATAISPGLSKVLVYETPNLTDTNILDGYSRIATDNLAQQISTSWGAPENQTSSALLNGENAIFQQMAAQGQSIFSVTGDNGAYDDGRTLSVDDPGAQPYVTGVGGTVLTTNGPGGGYQSEIVWGDTTDTTFSPLGSGGGGGFSKVWPVPGYQKSLGANFSGRSVPDVALNSEPNTGYSIYYKGTWHVYGGTSAAAPLWAGFTALVNQQRAAQGEAPVGFLNPLVYQIGGSSEYANDFHDTTVGDNLFYSATTGYDQAAGWGSFNGAPLLNSLVNGLTAPLNAAVTGAVTASDTQTPLAGVTVSAVSTVGGVIENTAVTATDGTFTLAVPSGFMLTIRANAYTASNSRYGGVQTYVILTTGQTIVHNFIVTPVHTFPAGLQMISTPFAYQNLIDPLPHLFGIEYLSNSSALRFAYWQPSLGTYIYYPTSPLNTLSAGLGYWAKFPLPTYLHYDGSLVPTATPFSLSLAPGWNQIGDPFPAPVALSTLTANGVSLAASTVVSPTLYRYDTAAGAYAALNPATDALQPYSGYWVYSSQTTQLSIPPPAGP